MSNASWRSTRVSRRRALQGAGAVGMGLAGAALIGCGGDDEPSNGGGGGGGGGATATSTGTAAPSGGPVKGGVLLLAGRALRLNDY